MHKLMAIIALGAIMGGILAARSLVPEGAHRTTAQSIGEQYSPALSALGPNTTLHTLFVEFRRHGELDEAMSARPDYRPETVYSKPG